jgi:hypothetical protein
MNTLLHTPGEPLSIGEVKLLSLASGTASGIYNIGRRKGGKVEGDGRKKKEMKMCHFPCGKKKSIKPLHHDPC